MAELERCHGVFCELRNSCARHRQKITLDYVPYLRNIPYNNRTRTCNLYVKAQDSQEDSRVQRYVKSDKARVIHDDL